MVLDKVPKSGTCMPGDAPSSGGHREPDRHGICPQRACSPSVKTDTQERGLWPSQNRRGVDDGAESWRRGTREEEAVRGWQSRTVWGVGLEPRPTGSPHEGRLPLSPFTGEPQEEWGPGEGEALGSLLDALVSPGTICGDRPSETLGVLPDSRQELHSDHLSCHCSL